VALACLVTILLAHEDPFARAALCAHIGGCPTIPHARAWYKIAYDLAVGAIVTLIFYALVVRLPDRQKRSRLRKGLTQQYIAFKKDSIATMLMTADGTYQTDVPETLLDRNEFRRYFSEDTGEDQTRWDRLFNNMEDHNLRDLLKQLEMLRDETAYVLNNVDIPGDEAFAFLKRLNRAIYSMSDTTNEYDDKKPFLRFLWEIFTGWSFVDGYQDRDIIEDMIKAI
jgi:hypothetical protein